MDMESGKNGGLVARAGGCHKAAEELGFTHSGIPISQTAEIARNQMQEFYDDNPSLDCILGLGNMAELQAQFVNDSMPAGTPFATFDFDGATPDLVEAGTCVFAVDQQPLMQVHPPFC